VYFHYGAVACLNGVLVPAIVPFANGLAWISLVTAGHTKRITTNTFVLIGYAIGNGAATFIWKVQYQPRWDPYSTTAGGSTHYFLRNHIPWAIITMGSVVSAILLLAIRFLLNAENRRRNAAESSSSQEEIYVAVVDEDGQEIEKPVDKVFAPCVTIASPDEAFKAFLDLTDRQNRDFRYVL
jgi:MFS transporter, ACS family, allantoate permease